MKRLQFVFISLSVFLLSGVSPAHEGARHEQNQSSDLLSAINAEYIATIKPIFRRTCFDCHSTQTRYPWYYTIPGIRQLIDRDVREAKKHLDMTHDFPFKGHGSPLKDFEAIQKAIRSNSMPPFRYRMMHWGAGVTKLEKEVILKWIDGNKQKVQD